MAPCQLIPGRSRPASWIIASRAGRAVLETFDKQLAARVNAGKHAHGACNRPAMLRDVADKLEDSL